MIKRLLAIFPLIALLVGVWQFENIYDWWWLRGYAPSAEIVAMADKSAMTAAGRRTFYLADPKIDQKNDFNNHCPVSELSLVLGCYTNQNLNGKVYVLKVERAELANVMEVTAAHEMLHAAYADLSTKERRQVDGWIEEFYKSVADGKVQELVAEYDRTEPGQRINELHSILPTQVAVLSPQLENYYKRYFINRPQIVTAYKSYEAVFENFENQIESLRTQINTMKARLENLDTEIEDRRAELEGIDQQLDNYRRQNNIGAYNNLVPTQNGLVRVYNNLIAQYRDLVGQHNSKVNELNQLALEQNQLVDSLDSTKFQPVNP